MSTKCIHCKKWSTLDGFKPKKTEHVTQTKPVLIMRWRKINTDDNENMRAAVWLYRAVPVISSKCLQNSFKIAVKTLMRYVHNSYNIHFKKYNLYFGDANTFGETDRSRPYVSETRKFRNIITITDDELETIRSYSDVPILAAKFLDIYMTTYKSVLGS